MYAVIATGGKQYTVHIGDELDVERLDAEPDSTVELRPLMLVGDDGDGVSVSADALGSATVTATVVEHRRDRKVTVFKYRNKSGYRRRNGHRQQKTRIRVDSITA